MRPDRYSRGIGGVAPDVAKRNGIKDAGVMKQIFRRKFAPERGAIGGEPVPPIRRPEKQSGVCVHVAREASVRRARWWHPVSGPASRVKSEAFPVWLGERQRLLPSQTAKITAVPPAVFKGGFCERVSYETAYLWPDGRCSPVGRWCGSRRGPDYGSCRRPVFDHL